MNTLKLKGKIVEKNRTYSECAQALGISTTGFSNKMNGRSNFDVLEINKLVEYLNLTDREAIDIFLPRNLHNTQVTN